MRNEPSTEDDGVSGHPIMREDWHTYRALVASFNPQVLSHFDMTLYNSLDSFAKTYADDAERQLFLKDFGAFVQGSRRAIELYRNSARRFRIEKNSQGEFTSTWSQELK